MKRLNLAALLLALILHGCRTSGDFAPVKADLALTNAAVWTGTRKLQNGWVTIRNGRIEAVGQGAAPAANRSLDASGLTILPGLTDAHAHLYGLGLSLDTVALAGTTSTSEIINLVRERASSCPRDEWILGRGWDQNDWAVKEFPTSEVLDAATVDHPVWLRRVDGHAGWANTAALKAANITAATRDPEGGRILRDSGGNPTGVFIDAAMGLIDRVVPDPPPELRKRRVRLAAETIAASGLTEIHDAGAGHETIRAIRELIDEKKFPIRVYLMLDDDDRLLDEWFSRGPLIDYGGKLTIRSVKMYADGALGSRGAALLEPYSDDRENKGLLLASQQRIAEISARARRSGFQVNTHAIGDRGTRVVLDAYDHAGVTAENRFRIEHLQVIALDDLPRLARRGIISSMQPTHATSDMYWAEARLGPKRILGAYAWRKVLDSGGRLALGSDFPVEDVNPMFGIFAAVTRQDQKGWPAGGWHPEEKLTLEEAIRGFTTDAAWAAFEEGSRGIIEPGKLADLTVVEGDLFETEPGSLFRVPVRYTIVNGEIVYDSRSMSSK